MRRRRFGFLCSRTPGLASPQQVRSQVDTELCGEIKGFGLVLAGLASGKHYTGEPWRLSCQALAIARGSLKKEHLIGMQSMIGGFE